MNNFTRIAVMATAFLTAGVVLPATAEAQRRGGDRQVGAPRTVGRGVARRPVSRHISRHIYRPISRRVYRPIVGRPLYVRRGFIGYPYGVWGWGPGAWWGVPYHGIGGPFWWPMSHRWWGPPVAFYGVPYGVGISEARLLVTPRETEVYVDGALAGVADQFDGIFQSLRLKPGTHEITLYLEGYRRFSRNVYVAPGSTLKLRHAMAPLATGDSADPRPIPPPRPPRSRDDDQEGSDQLQAPPPPHRVPREPREPRAPREPRGEVEVSRAGHTPLATEVTVRPGEVSTVNVSLPAADQQL